jgi:predicted ATPase
MDDLKPSAPFLKKGKRGTFVGRQHERAEIRLGLEDLVSGRGRLFLFAGEAGIGKTRLADEIAIEATSLGVQVAWGRCWDSEEAPAYWPWIQVLRSTIRGRDAATIASCLGSGGNTLLNLVPEFRIATAAPPRSDAPSPSNLDVSAGQHVPEIERFRLFDSVTNFFRNLALDNPLLIILDDAHLADVDSLLLLRFLARDLRSARIMLVVIYRDSEIRSDPRRSRLLNETGGEGECIVLRGLSESDTAELVEQTTGADRKSKLVAALQNTTDGNPFFLGEMIKLLVREGRTQSWASGPNPGFEVPDGVRSVIRRRVQQVSEATRKTVALASTIGREFDVSILRELSTLTDAELHLALDEAVQSGLLGMVRGSLPRYRYNHALVPETLYAELPAIARQNLHVKIAQTLERLTWGVEGPRFSEIAHHYIRALPAGPIDKAIEYATSGAQQALAVHAYDEAVRLYRTTLDILPLQSAPDEQLRFEVTLSLGDALNRAGMYDQCRGTFESAAEIARKLGKPDYLIRAALGRGMPITESGVVDWKLIALLEEALAVAEEDDLARRAMLMSRLAAELYWTDESERRAALAREAIEIARRLGDIRTLIYVLHYGHLALWLPDNLEDRLAAIDELIALAEETNSNHWALRGHYLRFVALLEMGDIQAARNELAAYRDLTLELQQPFGVQEFCEASMSLLEGNLDETLRIAERALTIGEGLEGRTGQFRQTFYAIDLAVRWQQGRLGDLQNMLRQIVDRSSGAEFRASDTIAARCALALCYCESGKRDEAAREFELLAADDFKSIPRRMTWLGCIILLSEVCAQLGDARRAALLYEQLLPYASRNPLLTWHVCFGSAQHYLGRLAVSMSRFDEAIEHFESALLGNQQMGARLWALHNQYFLGEALLLRNGKDDRQRAQHLLQECQETATQLGVSAVQQRAQGKIGLSGQTDAEIERKTADKDLNQFHCDGDFWTIRFGGRVLRLRDTKGMSYIARLLRNPGVELHSLDLVGAAELADSAQSAATIRASVVQEEGMQIGFPLDAGEMLDATAKTSYKRRLDELNQELEEAGEFGDADRAAGIKEEIDALVRELRRAIGMGGRDRRVGSATERARINVSRAMKAAIDRIGEKDPALGLLLSKSIKTGAFCSYVPDPSSIAWSL